MLIQGQAYFGHRLPAAGVRLRFYHRGFGGAAILLGDEVTTGEDGIYLFEYESRISPMNLEVWAVASDGRREVSLTETMFDIGERELINLVVPSEVRPVDAEYQRLETDVRRHLNGGRLADARESAEQRDVTLLHRSTRWDARLIALASTAAKLSSTIGVEPQALYGMLRAGLPTDPMQLARVSRTGVGHALRKANEAGVVALTSAQIEAAQVEFEKFARTTRRALMGPGVLSSYGEMLAAAGLSADEQNRFDEIFAAHRGSAEQLWQKTRDVGLPVGRLQVTARLGFLTLNNADLVAALRGEIGESEKLSEVLVGGRLYQPDTWASRLKSIAGDDNAVLADMIPPAFIGETTEERLAAYSADLARKVRVSYPTQVIGHMVLTDQLWLGADHQAVKADVVAVLDRATTVDGFSLGRTPVNVFVRDNAEFLFQGMPPAQAAAATEQVKTLYRLYQITPNDEALTVLLDSGFTSAYDVTAMSREKFVRRCTEKLSNAPLFELVYQKAQQVTTVVYTFFGAAKQLDYPAPVHVLSPSESGMREAKKDLIEHFPTMESLFGSLDYCECDHCRSVLSPAAYLVDLLKFLDPDQLEWDGDLLEWAETHAPYPYLDEEEWAADGKPASRTPYQVLTERRPDLPELPLTCENTHTVMPYIDIVNEILEYYLVNKKLDPDAGHDTGDAVSADLLAEPQHVLAKAYDLLREARYPLILPFDLWLETVRRYCEHFETPLWTILDALRTNGELNPPTGPAYGRAAVFLERLGISAEEYSIFTDPTPVANWHELYGYPPGGAAATEALTELASAKTLARRLGVSYRELVELIRSGFVNPRLDILVTLHKLGIDTEDVLRYQQQPGHAAFSPKERASFEAKLARVGGLAWLQRTWGSGHFARILVLADPDAGCGFETTTLRYADGTPADAMAFLTLNYLVRLWRRLGWPLADTDRALQVFLPRSPDPRTATTLGPAMATALVRIAHLDTLNGLLKGGKKGRATLLYLWSELDDAKYGELFLTGNPDPVFDHPLGQYLQSGGPLSDHLGGVQAALQLTADEVAQVLAHAGTSVDAASLTMDTVSRLYRYGLLAKALKLSVTEVVALAGLCGLNPFTPLHTGPVTSLEQDHPYHHTLGFVEVAGAVKESGLSVADLDYLLRHRFDPVGPYRLAALPPLTLVRTLAAEITRIRAEHAVPSDPLTFTEEVIRQKLALVLPPDVVEMFLGMWAGTAEFRAIRPGVAATDQLAPELFLDEPAISVSYHGTLNEQHLVYRRGVLSDVDRARLQTTFPQSLFAELLGMVQQQAHDFFVGNLQQAVVGSVPVGFLEPGDFDVLFGPFTPAQREQYDQTRRDTLAQAFLPFLQDRLIRQIVVQTVAADLGAEPSPGEALLTDPALLDDPDQPGRPLLDCYAAADDRGVSVTTGPDAVRLQGYLEVPAAGPYRFFVVCEQPGTQVELRFDHLTDPLLHATAASSGAELSQYTELRAGAPYGFTLDATALGGGEVTLLVQGEQLPKGPLDRLAVYPHASVGRIHRAHLLLAKTLHLLTALKLTEREARHLLTQPDDFGGLDLGELPTRAADDSPVKATTLFDQILRLVDYLRLRRELAAEPDDMMDLFAAARRTYPPGADPGAAEEEVLDDLCGRLAAITRRAPETVRAAADLLGMSTEALPAAERLDVVAAGFAQERGIGRLFEVLTMATKLGVTPDALGRWATPTPSAAVARDLRDTVKARYEPDQWRRVAQPISDKLRQRRRDALVAHIMHTDHFDRIEKLYEHFLIDPGTEPVVQTSRLRLAISSVQLFIQRCLLNLERQVGPWAINSAHWQWMKRYRVWEANRKIFLWPENWLEPEWRDDKTHLFIEMESALLQSDLSNENAETALFAYLRQLEELARLDIRAIYVEEKKDSESNTLHVVARTSRMPHKYFYRTYAHQMWTPWVPVTADIEGDHLTVVVWRGRVHLFWVTFLPREAKSDLGGKTDSLDKLTVGDLAGAESKCKYDAQLSWSEYFQGEWTNPASSEYQQLITDLRKTSPSDSKPMLWPPGFNPKGQFIHATVDDYDDSVCIHFTEFFDRAFRLVSKNSPPTVLTASTPVPPPYPFDRRESGRYIEDGKKLTVKYAEKITTKKGKTTDSCPTTKKILRKSAGYTLVTHADALRRPPADIGRLVSPFFYTDGRHTFYVEPVLTEETTIQQGDQFVLTESLVLTEMDDPGYWDLVDLIAHVPMGPGPVEDIAPMAKFAVTTPEDWTTKPNNLVQFGDALIGPAGGVTTIPIQEGQV